MKIQRKLTKKEWAEVIKIGPGVHMFRGKRTLIWNGEQLMEGRAPIARPRVYDKDERISWEVIIVLPGVEIIPEGTFISCGNVKVVIMADSVQRIEDWVFSWCSSLMFIKLSRNLEFIGMFAFNSCSLYSIFIPPSCREIGYMPFAECHKLLIFQVPQHTSLGYLALDTCAALFKASPFGPVPPHDIETGYTDEVTAWIRNVNGDSEEYALHRACCSFNPMIDIIYEIVKKQGLKSFQKPNGIGITPSKYLEENPFANIDQSAVVKRYVLDLMGIEYNMRE